jgi:hypothetical protein
MVTDVYCYQQTLWFCSLILDQPPLLTRLGCSIGHIVFGARASLTLQVRPLQNPAFLLLILAVHILVRSRMTVKILVLPVLTNIEYVLVVRVDRRSWHFSKSTVCNNC